MTKKTIAEKIIEGIGQGPIGRAAGQLSRHRCSNCKREVERLFAANRDISTITAIAGARRQSKTEGHEIWFFDGAHRDPVGRGSLVFKLDLEDLD